MMIGSGSTAYGESIRHYLARIATERSITGGPEGYAMKLGSMMRIYIESNPSPGVSPFLHMAFATWRNASVQLLVTGTPDQAVPFYPRIAETHDEVNAISRGLGFSAADACAGL
jgi:hypothetical protein